MNKCAALQMASGPNIRANLLEVEKLIADAAKKGAKLIALPENFALMGESEFDKVNQKEMEGSGEIQDFLSKTAKQHAIWLVAGTVPLIANDNNKIRAACLVYNDQGEQVARYDKIHLFDVDVPETNEQYRESDTIECGEQELVVDTPYGRLGIAICYDLRFPEFFRRMQQQGVEIFIVPSAFTAETGAAHWETLLRARAIENLSYVIAPNQGGFHLNGRHTYGHTMIIDPWGVVMASHESGSACVMAEIDIDRLHKIRESFPVLKHRQFFSN